MENKPEEQNLKNKFKKNIKNVFETDDTNEAIIEIEKLKKD